MVTKRVDYKRHIASLDGLRGVAICLVFMHHQYPRQRMNPLSILASAGWVGVDVFFVLSGFLITGILFDTAKKPHSLRNFFARRALRLFPIYFVIVGLLVLFSRPLHLPLDWRDIPFFAYGANISTALGINPPSFGPYLRFRHLWSLAVEEQFYLLWAPLVFVLGHRARVMKACVIGIVVAILLRIVGVGHVQPIVLYQSLFTRMDSILCGSMLALWIRGESGYEVLNKRRLHVMFAAGLAVLCATFLVSHSLFDQRASVQLVGYVGNDLWCTALLGLALLPGTVVNRWMNHQGLRFIGRYSYSLYLWHEVPGPIFDQFVLRVERMFGPAWLSGSLGFGMVFAFCLLLAIVSYHAVELPFLHLKRYFSYDPKVTADLPSADEESIDLRPTESSL
ncbi:MAG: acyltransferase [Acidobacteriaceae bacterium]